MRGVGVEIAADGPRFPRRSPAPTAAGRPLERHVFEKMGDPVLGRPSRAVFRLSGPKRRPRRMRGRAYASVTMRKPFGRAWVTFTGHKGPLWPVYRSAFTADMRLDPGQIVGEHGYPLRTASMIDRDSRGGRGGPHLLHAAATASGNFAACAVAKRDHGDVWRSRGMSQPPQRTPMAVCGSSTRAALAVHGQGDHGGWSARPHPRRTGPLPYSVAQPFDLHPWPSAEATLRNDNSAIEAATVRAPSLIVKLEEQPLEVRADLDIHGWR